ncbi:MAG: CoA transferase, partial [Caenibius sp.]
ERTLDEWLSVFEPADVWCSAVLNWEDLLESEGFEVLDLLQTVEREDNVSIRTTRSPIRVNGERPMVARAAPRIGEHNASITREFEL